MSFDFSGRAVVVTGASRGIGLAVARAFAEAGAELTLIADDEAVHEAAAALPGPARGRVCDIADAGQVAKALSPLARIDVLVNNAGLERPTPLDDPGADATFRRILDVNVVGTTNVTRTALSRIPRAGRIIVTSSIWGRTAVPRFGAYVASKHALIGLVRTWAKELGPRAITVNAVCPGWVRTESAMASLAALAAAEGRSPEALLADLDAAQAIAGLLTPADVAGLYLFLASDLAAAITGQAIHVDRGEVMG